MALRSPSRTSTAARLTPPGPADDRRTVPVRLLPWGWLPLRCSQPGESTPGPARLAWLSPRVPTGAFAAGFHTRFGPPSPFLTTLAAYASPSPVACFGHTHPWGFLLPAPRPPPRRARRGQARVGTSRMRPGGGYPARGSRPVPASAPLSRGDLPAPPLRPPRRPFRLRIHRCVRRHPRPSPTRRSGSSSGDRSVSSRCAPASLPAGSPPLGPDDASPGRRASKTSASPRCLPLPHVPATGPWVTEVEGRSPPGTDPLGPACARVRYASRRSGRSRLPASSAAVASPSPGTSPE
jgi:hypothetical protein